MYRHKDDLPRNIYNITDSQKKRVDTDMKRIITKVNNLSFYRGAINISKRLGLR